MFEMVTGELSKVRKERLKAHTEINGNKSISEYTL